MNFGNIENVAMCDTVTKSPGMKGIIQDTNKCLQECVLSLMDMREVLSGGKNDMEPQPGPECLMDEVMCCNARAHKLLDIIRDIQAVVM